MIQRLAGTVTSILVSPDFLPFLQALPGLDDLEVEAGFSEVRGDQSRQILHGADLANIVSLRTLSVSGKDPEQCIIEQLELVTQLQALHLHSILAVPDTTLQCCSILPALTSMTLHFSRPSFECMLISQDPLWLLERCAGQLQYLSLGSAYMEELSESPDQLCKFPSLSRLVCLELHFFGPEYKCDGIELEFPSLQTLSVSFTSFARGSYPIWDLSKCSALHTLALTFADAPDEQFGSHMVYDECPAFNLTGMTGVAAAELHLTLDVHSQTHTVADFSEWTLKAVRVYNRRAASWHRVKGVRDLLGALLGEVSLDEITYNDEPLGLQVI